MSYTKEQLEKQQEFLESVCDMFDEADFAYYARVTGKGMNWVMENAKYSDKNKGYVNNEVYGLFGELPNDLDSFLMF